MRHHTFQYRGETLHGVGLGASHAATVACVSSERIGSAPLTSSAPETVTKPYLVNLLGPDSSECIGSSAIQVFLGRVLGTPEAHWSRDRIGS